MPAAPEPANELERLAALRALDVLDTPPEPEFDRITRMASRLLGTPIALVSLVDRDRQWFKSCFGLDARETPRSQAFCAYAIHDTRPMIVPDATQDPRVCDSPLVTGPPHIRFYAGAPLIARSGHVLGTICAIDTVPREVSDEQLDHLEDLARITVDELELRLSNERLRELGEELAESNRELHDFAHMASHDLKEPLRHATFFCDVLRERLGDSDDRQTTEALGFVVQSATRMRRLIDSLLAYSRLRDGEEAKTAISADECVEEARALLEHAIEESDARLRSGPLPELVFDRTRLVQLFQNLIGNAIKYRSDAPPEIEISAERCGEGWAVSVADNGSGIAEKDRERVFAPFSRLSARAREDSTGLGLAICRRIVEKRSGTIRVESAPGEGSCFVFTVPDPPGTGAPGARGD